VGHEDRNQLFLVQCIVYCLNFSTGNQCLQYCSQVSTLLSLVSFIEPAILAGKKGRSTKVKDGIRNLGTISLIDTTSNFMAVECFGQVWQQHARGQLPYSGRLSSGAYNTN